MENSKEKICLILTATIEVRNKALSKRNDTLTRLNDYKTMLKFWLTKQKSISRIVFTDNSSYPLDELKEIVRRNNPYKKEVEFLSFTAVGREAQTKGYGELGIDRYVLDNSRIVKGATYFVHCGGRVFIENIDAIIAGLPDEFHMISTWQNNLANSQTDIFITGKDFFNNHMYGYLEAAIDDVNKMYYERAFTRALHLALSKDYHWFPFAVEPIVCGVSGAKNQRFKMGRLRSRYITFISHLEDRFRRNSHGRNRQHLLDMWQVPPKQ